MLTAAKNRRMQSSAPPENILYFFSKGQPEYCAPGVICQRACARGDELRGGSPSEVVAIAEQVMSFTRREIEECDRVKVCIAPKPLAPKNRIGKRDC